MILRADFNLQISNELKHLHLLFGASFTRVAIGTNEDKTNSGFTKYFRQIKKEVLKEPDADRYIFVFSVKEWEKYRNDIINADGKIIIIDNGGITLFADDEMMEALNSGSLLERNQWIVKDSLPDGDDDRLLNSFDEVQMAWLSEIQRHELTEVRLTYKDRLTNLGNSKVLFTDKEVIIRYGLDILKEPRNTEFDGTDDYDVIDVTDWNPEAIQEYFQKVPNAKILSESLPADEILEQCTVVLENTEQIQNVFYMDEYEFKESSAVRLYYRIKQQTATAKFIGPIVIKGYGLKGSIYYLWKSKEENQLYVSVVFDDELKNVTYEIELLEPLDEGRFSLRIVGSEGLTAGDTLLLLSLLLKELKQLSQIEGRLLWEGGPVVC